jgi:predicted metalloendopeptidase
MQNVLTILAVHTQNRLRSLRQSIDRTAWTFPPAIVNAFYDPSFNDICNIGFFNNKMPYRRFSLGFPAGILQLPFFHKDAPK